MNAVIDTNVLVASFWSKDGTCAKILSKVLKGEMTVVYDYRVLEEYREVLLRPKFCFSEVEVDTILDFIKKEGMCIVANEIKEKFDDESDKKFYELAKTLNCILITGNKKHYPNDSLIVEPKDIVNDFEISEEIKNEEEKIREKYK